MVASGEKQTNAEREIFFPLPASVTIETVETLASELSKLPLSDKPLLALDASSTVLITTPGLQLIIALERNLSESGGTLSMGKVSDPVAQAFREAGLESFLHKLTAQHTGALQ